MTDEYLVANKLIEAFQPAIDIIISKLKLTETSCE
jgi:hypothetical protein